MKTVNAWLIPAMAVFCSVVLPPPVAANGPKPKEATAIEVPPEKPPKGGVINFSFANVHRRAAALAAEPYKPDRPELPDFLKNLSYDQYRDIRFRPDYAIWRGQNSPFEVQLFSRGFLHQDRVTINLVENGEVHELAYSPDLFDLGKNTFPEQIPNHIGFAGFRLHYPLNRDDYFDEVAVFLGASYFRAVGQKQNYGLSARGLAVDTALTKPEEFPVFREFWIEKPQPDATEITVYGLMDSPRTTGAYRFVIKPGLHTVMEVKAHLFLREKVDKLGVAPVTSMFLFGENTERYTNDFRPEVHDSDGLLIVAGNGERLWRPLNNLRELNVSAFEVTDPMAFGLLQRDREYDHYQDLEANYQTRPSLLVEPIGKWGTGAVELVEIPTTAEKYDNIVAFWRPQGETQAGQEFDFEYRLRWAMDAEGRILNGRTIATRIGAGGADGPDQATRRFVLDFAGTSFVDLAPDEPVEAVITASAGRLFNQVVQQNPHTGGRRVFFELAPEGAEAVDLRCFLRSGDRVLTETWTYQWKPQ